MSGIAILFSIPMLILRVIALILCASWRRRLTRPIFYFTLRREGLSHEEARILTSEYNLRIPLRDLVRIGSHVEGRRPS